MKFKRLNTIKIKILIIFLIASFVLTALLVSLSNNLSIDTLSNLMNEKAYNDVKLYSNMVGDWIHERVKEIEDYSRIPLVKTMDWEKIEPFLKDEMDNKNNKYLFMFIADAQGDYNTTLKRNAGNVSDREYFHNALAGETYVSDPIISKSTGMYTLAISSPIKDDSGYTVGVFAAAFDLDMLSEYISEFKVEHDRSYSYIVDNQGTIIAHPNRDLIMKKDSGVSIADDGNGIQLINGILCDGKKYCGQNAADIDINENLYYFRSIPHTDGWKIITYIPAEYRSYPIKRARNKLMSIGFGGIVVSFILAFFIAKKISDPIIQLKEVFNKGAEGDLTVRAEVLSNDEIGEASKSFNKMMDIINHMTYNDSLTNIPNLTSFKKQLDLAEFHAKNNNEILSVISIGVDKFTNINDTFGYTVGNALLKMLVKRVKGILPKEFMISRIDGDEFAILITELTMERYVVGMISTILEEIRKPWNIGSNSFYITVSIGVTFYPSDRGDLLKNANVAMHRAKEMGGDRYQFYEPRMNEELAKQLKLDKDMHEAINNEEFVVYYQPLVNIISEEVEGIEALVRWMHPELGLISPGMFIPLAEDNGLIVKLGEWVLRTACMQNKVWQDAGYDHIYVSVNISMLQFKQENFVAKVKSILKETGLYPEYLQLEITETVAVSDVKYTVQILNKLRDIGISIAIDDFGTGHSSFSYLKTFAIDNLKIDKSFIDNINENFKDAAITSSVIALGKNLKLKITAEGVENKEQLDFLSKEGCDIIQGYFYSKPLLPKDVEKFF